MKILFASRYVDPEPVGSNKNVYLQAQSLKKDFGIEVEILTWPKNDLWTGPIPSEKKQCPPLKVNREGIVYHVFTASSAWNVTAGGAVISDHDWEQAVQYGVKILEKLDPDIVHLQHRHGMWWILESAQRLGLPTVYSNHDWGIACKRTVLVKGDGTLCDGVVDPGKCAQCVKVGRRTLLGRANEALVSAFPAGKMLAKMAIKTPFMGAALRQKGMVTESALNRTTTNYKRSTGAISHLAHCFTPSQFGKVFFSQLGCPTDKITVQPWYHDPVYTKKTIAFDQPFTITFISRVSPEKGVDLIFSALEKLTNIEPILLRVAGANNSVYCSDLKKKFSANVGIHSVEWLGWSEVAPLFQDTDVTVIPSVLIDNTPLALIESLAYKVPVIATKVPPIEELITDGKTGFLTEYRSVESLAEGISRAICSKQVIRAGKQPFPPILGIQEYTKKIFLVYKTIVAGKRGEE